MDEREERFSNQKSPPDRRAELYLGPASVAASERLMSSRLARALVVFSRQPQLLLAAVAADVSSD